jgi:large subunit ribosomal protein L25
MQRVEMEAARRAASGKGPARQLRRAGQIPGVLYGEGKSILLTLQSIELARVLKAGSGENALISLKITSPTGAETRTAILRDLQRDPITGEVLHADLFEISMNKTIRIRVPIAVVGDVPAGVKEGGVLQHSLREIEIECLPAQIPGRIEIDASALNVGDSVHLRDLKVGEGVRLIGDADLALVSVAAPMSEAKLEQILAGTPAETKEPEVIGKAKEEGAEAAPAEGEKGEKGEKGKPAEAPKAAAGAKKPEEKKEKK